MRVGLLFAALLACGGVDAMPLGLRTAMWGVGDANRRAALDAVFPALGGEVTAAEVAAALDGAADGALAENIRDAGEYSEFREWAKCAGAAAVKTCGRAWLSYALGADALMGKEIASNDVHIVSFGAVGDDGGGGALGTTRPASFTFEVAIDGVNIGGGSVAEEVLKENLKKVLGLEGSATLDPAEFSANNIDIVFDAPANGKARFTATPPVGAGSTYFMRVKVK